MDDGAALRRAARAGLRDQRVVIGVCAETVQDLDRRAEPIGLAEDADLLLALAVIHHLAISGRVPLARVTDWLRRISRFAVVEVPDRDDPMVARLAAGAPEHARAFGLAEFRAACVGRFEVIKESRLTGLPRTIFLLRSVPV